MLIFFFCPPILGSDHGIKAQGDGWLLTVALIEGNNLASVDSGGYSDPYVVFTCNGKVRTSSIKFQKSNPLWNGEYHKPLNKLNTVLV
jgi:Ca2+-dependent lipid-binding protein